MRDRHRPCAIGDAKTVEAANVAEKKQSFHDSCQPF